MASLVPSVAAEVLRCCSCIGQDTENEVTYTHPCYCITPMVTFRSSMKTVTLCGFDEFSGGPNEVELSIPRRRYKKRSKIESQTHKAERSWLTCLTSWEAAGDSYECEGLFIIPMQRRIHYNGLFTYRDAYTIVRTQTSEYIVDKDSCVRISDTDLTEGQEPDLNPNPCAGLFMGSSCANDDPSRCRNAQFHPGTYDDFDTGAIIESPTYSVHIWGYNSTPSYYTSEKATSYGGCPAGYSNWISVGGAPSEAGIHTKYEEVLSEEDTEEDAQARAGIVGGSWTDDNDPSLWPVVSEAAAIASWPLRTTTTSYVTSRVCISVRVAGLDPRLKYAGCFILQRRESYAGTPPSSADLDWKDIEQVVIPEFVADPEEDGLTTVVTDEELPYAQGWDYRIKPLPDGSMVAIWPTTSLCTCPEMENE